jgi:hypothetical protein
VQTVVGELREGLAISLKRIDNESEALSHAVIFKDVVGSPKAGRQQAIKGRPNHQAVETSRLVLHEFGQVSTSQIHGNMHFERETDRRLAHGLQLRHDAVELHPAFGQASGALLQQAFGLGLHVALDPLHQHAEKERREKIKPGAKHECPTPLHQQSRFCLLHLHTSGLI